jgi:arylsulfatase A-like enzyme
MKSRVLFFSAAIIAIAILIHVYLSYRSYNVILITLDTQRSDYLSCYNPATAPTPNIDRIAREGIQFTNAFSLIPITMPAHAAIFTSHPPHDLKVFNNGDKFQHNFPMFTDLLEQKGYTTVGFISLGILNRNFGLAQGFDQYNDDFSKTNGRSYKWASEINEAVLPWIEKNKKRKFFAWIHYSDPHEPYIPFDAPPDTEIVVNGQSYGRYCLAKKERIGLNFLAAPGENKIELKAIGESQLRQSYRFIDQNLSIEPKYEIRFGEGWTNLKLRTGSEVRVFQQAGAIFIRNNSSTAQQIRLRLSGGVWENRGSRIRANYASEVQFVDRHIGILWRKLSEWNLLNKTIVILLADHGEGLKTHGILGHVDKLWNETTHIPFLIYYPGLGRAGTKIDLLVNQFDIMPTILDLAHVKNKKPMKGYSLKRYISRSPIDRLFSRKIERQWSYACTFRPEASNNSFSVTNGKIKLINTPTIRFEQWEAYDLVKDPIEKQNLARTDPEQFQKLASLRALLQNHRQEAEAVHAKRETPQLTADEEEMLRTLGYVAGNETTPQK